MSAKLAAMIGRSSSRLALLLVVAAALWTPAAAREKAFFAAAKSSSSLRQPFAVVQPVADHTKLEVDPAGMAVLRKLKGRLVAPVVVIGPYRSGKSFTLNQLLGVGCDEGFGVGHTRLTQTKGVWVWGEPIPVKMANGREVDLLFFDTEGFESTGKADSYDDRIFALSTLISSVLVYNLPESIRESDVEKLSFAAELAKAFYTDNEEENGSSSSSSESPDPPVRPGSMVWLIQRDFLRGASLKVTLQEALKQVPNPHSDPAIAQMNRIRQGLTRIAANSTAMGLPQPHLDRTRLCEIPDADLDPVYLQKREELKTAVHALAEPKVVRGAALDGPGLADLITRVVTALNARDIPTAGSLVAYFNKELVEACREQFSKALDRVAVPVDAETLAKAAVRAGVAARHKFEHERFGSDITELRDALELALTRELSAKEISNTYQSSKRCESEEMACEAALERAAGQKLPSTGRFRARYDRCRASFDAKCVGPAREHNLMRLERAWERENGRFSRDYNDRLYNGLVMISVVTIVVFRFVVRWTLGESGGWGAFIFLQVYSRSFFGSGTSMFDTAGWQWAVTGWEFVVNNPVIGGEWGLPILGAVAAAYVTRRRWSQLKARGWWARLGWRKRSKTHVDRDLMV